MSNTSKMEKKQDTITEELIIHNTFIYFLE